MPKVYMYMHNIYIHMSTCCATACVYLASMSPAQNSNFFSLIVQVFLDVSSDMSYPGVKTSLNVHEDGVLGKGGFGVVFRGELVRVTDKQKVSEVST